MSTALTAGDLHALDRFTPAGAPTSTGSRGARTILFVLVGLVLAIGAHRIGGDPAPSSLTEAGAAVVLGLLGWVLTARERRGWVIAVVVVASQAVLHIGFTLAALLPALLAHRSGGAGVDWAAALFCHHGSTPITPAQIAQVTAELDPASLRRAAGGSTAAGPTAGLVTGSAVAMLCGHLGAALLTAWWLRRGERTVWKATRRAAVRLDQAARACGLVLPAPAGMRPAHAAPWRPRSALLLFSRPGRAPPRQVVDSLFCA